MPNPPSPEELEKKLNIVELPRPGVGERLGALMARDFPPLRWIVPDFIPEGLTLLAGPSKLGKSWLALETCLAVGFGGEVLGKPVERGDVLYWALEDGSRRLQSRVQKLLPHGRYDDCALTLRTLEDLPNALDEGGLKDLQRWAASVDKPRLVVIDVLAKVKPQGKGSDSEYDQIYKGLRDIHRFALENDIGVIVIHHTRKGVSDGDPFDKVSGTRAFTALPDATLVLDRDPGGWADAILYGRGRDLEEFEISLDHDDNGRWTVMGDAEAAQRCDSKKLVIEVLKRDGEMQAAEIGFRTGLGEYARKLCDRMAKSGDIKKTGPGRYAAP